MLPIHRLPCQLPIVTRRSLDLSLYLVANRPSFQNENVFMEKIQAAVAGGVSCVQLRDHKNDIEAVIKTAHCLKGILKGIPLFINTPQPFEVVSAVDAEGVYLEEKIPYQRARKLIGISKIVGISVKTMEEVRAVEQAYDVDYLSVKIFPSRKTCPRNDFLWGMEGLRRVRAITPHRIVVIGGLNVSCVEPAYRAIRLDDGVAMAGGLMDEEDPETTARKILAIRQNIWRNNDISFS
ncbi:MAG: thiamine phosphate synthase [Chlamydiales bacterium]